MKKKKRKHSIRVLKDILRDIDHLAISISRKKIITVKNLTSCLIHTTPVNYTRWITTRHADECSGYSPITGMNLYIRWIPITINGSESTLRVRPTFRARPFAVSDLLLDTATILLDFPCYIDYHVSLSKQPLWAPCNPVCTVVCTSVSVTHINIRIHVVVFPEEERARSLRQVVACLWWIVFNSEWRWDTMRK